MTLARPIRSQSVISVTGDNYVHRGHQRHRYLQGNWIVVPNGIHSNANYCLCVRVSHRNNALIFFLLRALSLCFEYVSTYVWTLWHQICAVEQQTHIDCLLTVSRIHVTAVIAAFGTLTENVDGPEMHLTVNFDRAFDRQMSCMWRSNCVSYVTVTLMCLIIDCNASVKIHTINLRLTESESLQRIQICIIACDYISIIDSHNSVKIHRIDSTLTKSQVLQRMKQL
jgi:hypothetical protein